MKRHFSLSGITTGTIYLNTHVEVDIPNGASEDEIEAIINTAAKETYWLPNEDQGYGFEGDSIEEVMNYEEISDGEFQPVGRYGHEE